MKSRHGVMALAVAGAIALTGCSTKPQKDTTGCLVIESRYSTVVSIMERWQYGNATTASFLDALADLQSSAIYQRDQAKSADLKRAGGDLGAATQQLYRAVNSGAGVDAAGSAVAAAKRAVNGLC